ncbi:MAG: hypothetical protein ACI4BC_00615 [Muribaculaceae bacterium]
MGRSTRFGVPSSVADGCHRLLGGNYICVLDAPGISPRPRVAQYRATHSANRLPGLENTLPIVIITIGTSVSEPFPFNTCSR